MFIELHAQSAFSFLEGAAEPEAFAAEAARLGMPAVALVDRDGVYGAPRFTRAPLRTNTSTIWPFTCGLTETMSCFTCASSVDTLPPLVSHR